MSRCVLLPIALELEAAGQKAASCFHGWELVQTAYQDLRAVQEKLDFATELIKDHSNAKEGSQPEIGMPNMVWKMAGVWERGSTVDGELMV